MTNETNQTTLFDTPPANGAPATSEPAEERPGYQFVKRVGWIPQSWTSQRLGSLITQMKAGYSAASTDQPAQDGEKGVLKVSAVSEGVLRTEENKAVVPTDFDKLKCALTADRVVISRSNGNIDLVGVCAYVETDYPHLFLPDTLWQIETGEGANTKWLNQLLRARYVRNRIKQVASGGSGNKKLSMKKLRAIVVGVPPLPEQRKIACILGAWDRALADLDALIEAKRRQRKGLAQRLLTGRVRLSGFEGRRIPMRPLSEFFRHFSKRNKEGRDLTALSCSKVHGIVPQTEIFDKRVASDDTSRYKIVERGDLVYDPMLLWDASIGFSEAVDEGVISPAYATFHLNEETASRAFFRHFFDSHYMRHQYKVISQGTNKRRRKAMASDFLKVEARVPPLDEQRQIAAVLDAADAEIAALEAQRDALARQKRGLMQRLLTGEVRVTPDPEDHRPKEPGA